MANEGPTIEVNAGNGCLFFFAAIIMAVCIGSIYEAVYGWLAFGLGIGLWALINRGQK